MSNVSVLTILLAGLLSVITGYFGSLINSSRQRFQDRRVLGLAFLAEVKNVQRGLRRYLALLDRVGCDEAGATDELGPETRVRRWRHSISVHTNNSGRIGLFSIPTAIELVEFYFRLRMLEVRVDEISRLIERDGARIGSWLADHRRLILSASRHSRAVAHPLHREVPLTGPELLRYVIRRRHFRVQREPFRRVRMSVGSRRGDIGV